MISTILDGVTTRSFILDEFDIVTTVQEIKQALLSHLGYSVSK